MNRSSIPAVATLVALLSLLLSAPPIHAAEVLDSTGTWRYLKAKAEASSPDRTAWRQPAFNDQSWSTGTAPFYYGKPYVGTELSDMRGSYSGVYLRRTFTIADPQKIGSFKIHALSDDGFIAWINGQEVARFNVPEGELAFNAIALPPLEEPVSPQDVQVAEPWKYLVPGNNVIAVQALNSSLAASPDFAIFVTAEAEEDNTVPTLVDAIPTAGSTVDSLTVVEVEFSEPVTGVDAGDLLVNGTPAGALEKLSPTSFKFGFTQPAAGSVEFKWKDGHGITDILGAPHAFAGGSWSVKLDPAAARAKVFISEFVADNDKSLLDEDCDNSDWIEIYNGGTTPVNLKGWALTDDPTSLAKWRFPDYLLGADSYVIVYASQKDKTNLSSVVARACRGRPNQVTGFHTNFKLANGGEYLALVAPDGQVVSDFSPGYPPQTRDISYGRVPGDAPAFGYFATPTPRARNSDSGSGFSPKVVFSRKTGMITEPFDLSLSTIDPKAVIKYTVDGTFPAETNKALKVYSGPIAVTNTIQVRARAYSPGLLPGAVNTETWVLLTNAPAHRGSFTSALPIVVVSTLKTASFSSTRNTTVSFSVYEPVNGLTTITGNPSFTTRAGMKTRGSSTGGQTQSNFAVDIWDEFDQDKDAEILGMPEDSEWVLYAPNGFDPMLIHNPFTMELSRQMNFAAPRTRFVEVYINKGGQMNSNQWFGLYVFMEKPGLSKGRIDAPKAQPEDVEFPEITGSYMFKTDRLDESGGDTGFSAGGSTSGYVEPKESEMKSPQRAPQLAYLTQYFKDMDASMKLTNPNLRHPTLGYRGYLEITNWMDFHVLETLSGQVDAIRLSTYFYKRRNGKIEYGPRWDYDRAWESKDDSRDDNPRIWATDSGNFGPPWWNTLLRDADAWQVWIDRYQLHRRGPLALQNMYSVIDRMTNEVRWVQPREAKKYAETAPRTSYANETLIMKRWISNRVVWMDSQMAHPAKFSQPGGRVAKGFQLTLEPPTNASSPANVQIYYTLDGSDPRPFGGTGVITSFQYTGPIVITNNTRVTVRVRDTGRKQAGGPLATTPWSMPIAETYVVTAPALTVTEIMYHPASPNSGDYTNGDFEFIELKNTSDRELNLAGYHFRNGIDFVFTDASPVKTLAPGARVVLVSNLAAFLSRYPGVVNVGGQFTGSLADSGEHLVLAGPAQETIFDFTFSDSWQRLSDGAGFSLVLADESTPNSLLGEGSKWRLSAAIGGSPGIADPQPTVVPRVVVSEVLPKTAAVGGESQIELQNLENTTADVAGWWLSDDFSNPFKARLPAGTQIARNGFLSLRERVFNPDGAAGFGIDSDGDSVWLFSADRDGALTGWYHGFSFGASVPGQSFGRHVLSTGEERIAAQRQATIGAANAGPAVGPVVFTEINFHPPGDGITNNVTDEFIEILNTAATGTALFDPSHTTNTWRIRGGVDFDFPENVTLPAGGRALLVGIDPATQTAALASLRARAGLNPNTPVFGPWSGTLDNAGENLRIERPGAPKVDADTGDTTVPHLIVDEVTFTHDAPWPGNAGGLGSSLARRDVTGYADDPANWLAALRLVPGADADNDGLPDEWETANGLATNSGAGDNGPDGDPDGDGFNNRQELLNGTDPRNAASAVRLGVSFGGGNYINLHLAASPGRTFRVESSSTLANGSWQFVRDVTVTAAGLGVIDSEPASDTPRYYRVSTGQ